MNKTKVWVIIAASLILIGTIVFVGVMMALDWDFTKLSTTTYETNLYEISESFSDISLLTDTADVTFVLSEDGKTRVGCYEQSTVKHSVSVENGALKIEAVDTRKWHNHIGINFATPKITVFLPKGDYGALLAKSSTGDIKIARDFSFNSIDVITSTGDVENSASAEGSIKIKTSTGSIKGEHIFADSLELSVSTGKVSVVSSDIANAVKIDVSTGKANLDDIACKSLLSTGDTGDITLKSIIAAEKISIKRSTGDINFDGCDAAELLAETDTGSVKGSLLSDKVFITRTDTGNISVPKTTTGGKAEITTDTGDIKIEIKQPPSYQN